MFKLFNKSTFWLVILAFSLAGCKTTYMTQDGEKLIGNSVVGCIAGAVFLDNCQAGALGGAAATVYANETK